MALYLGMASIAPYIHRKVVVLRENSSAVQAARAMKENGIGCVLVSDLEHHIVGILTDRDLVCRLVARETLGTKSLASIMTPNPLSLQENAEVTAVIELMETHGIRRVPIIRMGTRGRQHCVGLVSFDDLIGSREIDDYHSMRVVRGQIKKRALGSSEFRSWLELNEPGQFSSERKSDESLYQGVSVATGLTLERSKALVQRISESLVGRLNDTAAVHFIVSLPAELQRDLGDTPAGPDPKITAQTLVNQLIDAFGWSQAEALSYIFQTCRVLEEWVGFKKFSYVKAQFNEEFRHLFSAINRKYERQAA
jgi:CBS domain-containing protein